MDKFKEEFYRILINKENFYIKQYHSNFHKNEEYIAIKELENGIYCVLITTENDEEIDIAEGIQYIKSLGKTFSFNTIILSSGGYELVNEQLPVNKLIIDKKKYNVIRCDDFCMPLKRIFDNIMREKKEKYNFLKYKITTLVIMAINIIMFIITQTITNNKVNNIMNTLQGYSIDDKNKIINYINNLVLISFGAKYNELINSGQVWRLLTCAFLHFSLIHIVCNMYSIYIVGPQIEQIYGVKKYLGIYFLSCITASSASYFMSPDSISAGASGGLFGLMGALVAFAIIERNKINKKYMSSLLQVIAVNLFIGLSIKNIDNYAHIGGLIGGIAIGYISYNLAVKKHNRS